MDGDGDGDGETAALDGDFGEFGADMKAESWWRTAAIQCVR